MTEQFLHGVEVIDINDGARPIQTVKSSVIGLVGTAPKGPVNIPTLLLGSLSEAVEIFGSDKNFTIPAALDLIFKQTGAMVVVVNVADPTKTAHKTANVLDPAKITLSDIVGGVDSQTGKYTGVSGLLAANSEVKVQPRILIAPGFTHQTPLDEDDEPTANPVVAALLNAAETLRAIIVADCPNTNKTDAINYANDWGSARIYPAFPWVKVLNTANNTIVEKPASSCIAGLIAKSDNERGFWWSPSNMVINGIVGTSKPVDFALGNTSCTANFLNEHGIATIIQQDGFRLWGNRTVSSDAKWIFLQTRRTADMINDSLLKAHLWAVDRNITKTYIDDVLEGVNNYLRYLKSIQAIIDGKAFINPELNTPSQIAQGKVTFDFDFTPPYPAEHITFRSRMTDEYLVELFSN
ncbi:MAG: phage tail sheath subtilisin-like domain-containing protein [Proteobacteria bacterium]|nr:phage tail sheath subtilisin-like domain-containing protein [Pseudomonadota bacterium]